MRAADKVHAAAGKAFAGAARFLFRDQPRQPTDIEREAVETLGEAGVVLAGEQSCRGDDGHLLSGHRGDESGAQRHLGLAEADIAADETVHWFAAAEIVKNIGNRVFLVLGLGPGEPIDELVEGGFVGQQGRGRAQRAFGGRLHQLARDFADAFLQACPALLPGLAPQLVELDAFGLAAIAREHVEVLDRDVELVAAMVGQHHAIMRGLADRD